MKKKNYSFFPEGIYKGQMRGGVAHGKGTYTSGFKGKKGRYKYFYKGDWINGKRHGKGKQIINLNKFVIKYVGGFKNDVSNGHGILIQRYNGKLYEKFVGQFKDSVRTKGKRTDYKEKWKQEEYRKDPVKRKEIDKYNNSIK